MSTERIADALEELVRLQTMQTFIAMSNFYETGEPEDVQEHMDGFEDFTETLRDMYRPPHSLYAHKTEMGVLKLGCGTCTASFEDVQAAVGEGCPEDFGMGIPPNGVPLPLDDIDTALAKLAEVEAIQGVVGSR